MKVAMYYNNNDLRIEEIPKPEINEDEILYKVEACGICGSDVMEWYRIKKAPIVLGHEAVGTIIEVGNNVKNYKVGQRVFVSHHVPCDNCHFCKNNHHTACETLHKTNFYPGGFSEFIRVPKINVDKGIYLLPDNVSFDEAVFIEPLATVLRAQRLLKINKNDAVLIIGSGISGLLHIQIARFNKAKRVIATDINDYRLKAAKKFGADFVFNGKEDIKEKIKKANNDKLADKVIVCTGALPAARQALECIEKGGTIQYFAVPKPEEKLEVPINDFWRNEVTIMTSYGAAPDDLKEALNLIKSKNIDAKGMVTHKFPLKETEKGFKLVSNAKESIKVIIEPNK
ncbi:zinc-dependent dehydrogenase [Candidatus Woesearchaeota archaeon]|nr:zinc-dependent dehydrogenase [Candidatus Woesearchaeota archaeon]